MPGLPKTLPAWCRSALLLPALLAVLEGPLPANDHVPEPPICAANPVESPSPEVDAIIDPAVYRYYRADDMVLVTGSDPRDAAYLHPVAAGPFIRMRNAAMADGLEVEISSGWRSWDRQMKAHRIFLRTGRNLSGDRVPYVAHPAGSKHPAGIAVDLRIEPGSALPGWLEANAPCFGFVNTREDEPWEYQFTGFGSADERGPQL